MVYAGSVWLTCWSLTELNKVLSSPKPGVFLIGLNAGIFISSLRFVGELSSLIITKNKI
jgi:hypothetical protein